MPSLAIGLSLRGRANSAVSPNFLFASSEQGAWYDPSDLATLFQDSAGATPVTTAGQTVGKILDKSGRGNHATQATLAQRPTYEVDGTGRPYLSFDGVDDGMVTGTITPGIDKVQMFAGIHKLSDAALQTVAEFSANPTNLLFPGSCGLTLSPGAPNTFAFFVSGGSIPNARANVNLDASPQTKVFSGIGDISADSSIARVNGVQLGSAAADQGTGNYLAYPLYIGRRAAWGATSPFSGRIYSLIVRFGANLTAGQIASTEAYVNGKTGAY